MIIRKRINPSGATRYQLDLGVIHGKRVRQTFATRQEAQDALANKKDEQMMHGKAALLLTESERYRFSAAQEKLRAHNATIEDAVAFFLAHNKPREIVTFAELGERCVQHKASLNKRPAYLNALRLTALAFGRAGHSQTDADQITRQDVEKWIKGQGWKPKSQIVYLINLTTIFSWGLDRGHVTINPCTKIERPTLDDKPPAILTVPQCESLLKAALDTDSPTLPRGTRLELLAYVSLCLFAGIRPEETKRLDWSEVDLEEKIIKIPALKSKTRRRRIVTMSENLFAWLSRSHNQTGPVTPQGLQKRLRAVRAFADLDEWPQDVMRHSFASYHLAKYGSAEKTALQMGHAGTQILFEHYREIVRPRDATAFWELRPET